ncbi:hypothetical protein CRENBAI_000472 [Crenichthys baileyi]|uniref:Signal-induced proliferation-associated 1-like protein 2 n=1 Tax=Crenichthys baileyi TaxID=28760 RepID=A0AAV9SMU0_9TELE
MALWRKSSPASFCLSRYAPPLRRPVRHTGNGNKSLLSAGFIIPGDIIAAMSVELRMFNSATKIDDSNNRYNTGTIQVLRTHLIENNSVTVIFQEPDAPRFNPKNIRSHFQGVFIIVRVHQPCTQHTCYSLAVFRCRGIPPFGPSIPPGWMLPASSAFRDFLLTKIINATHATRKSESFVTMATCARQEQLKRLVETFVTLTPLDCSNVRFSFISLGGKKKERLARQPQAYLHSAGALTWSVTVRDPSSSAAVACQLAISSSLVVLIEEVGRKVVFNCFCRDVIGWSAAHGSFKLFYQHGLCVPFSTRDGRWEDSQEITQRLQLVTQGGTAANMTLRRNRLGQLGFHINSEGVVADVEAHGFAWQAGLRPGCRLVEICLVAVVTLSHEQMIELLRTSRNVTTVVLPPHGDGTPRRSYSETYRLPLLEVKLDSDVTSCPHGVVPHNCLSAAPPTPRESSSHNPSSDMNVGRRAPPDWLVSYDESTESTQGRTSRTSGVKETKNLCHPHNLPDQVTKVLSATDRDSSRRTQRFATKSCSSCSNTFSSSSSDCKTSTPQLMCLRGVSVDSSINSTHYMSSALPRIAGATLVLTDILGKKTAGSNSHVTDLSGTDSLSRDSCGSRCSSADKMKVKPYANSSEAFVACAGDSGLDSESLFSQGTCRWEAGLNWLTSSSLLDETNRPSCHPNRDVYVGEQKDSDETAIVSCVKGADKREYRGVISSFTEWSRRNNLILNTLKTKEMITDHGRKPSHEPIPILVL